MSDAVTRTNPALFVTIEGTNKAGKLIIEQVSFSSVDESVKDFADRVAIVIEYVGRRVQENKP